MLKGFGPRRAEAVLAVLVTLAGMPAWAIDNPDAPNYVTAFEQRARPFEDKISQAAGSGAVVAAYAGYERFLDAELNHAYAALASKLDKPRKTQLQRSQRAWLGFRDAEAAFITSNWTMQRSGSSSGLSRGAYRSTLIRDRIMGLLNYLKNAP